MLNAYLKTSKILWKMPYKQLSLILVILLLITFFIVGCKPTAKDTFSELIQIQQVIKLIEDSKDENVPYTVRVDITNPDKPIILIEARNTASDAAFSITVPIDQESGFTTDPITFENKVVPEPISPHEFRETITVKSSSAEPVTFDVIIRISGAPVEDWFSTSNINANFNVQAVPLMLSGNTLSVNGLTNDDSGTGSINFILPAGFVASPNIIPLTDPDGTDTVTITLDPNTFTISETGNPGNSKEYTIGEITFEATFVPSGLIPEEHISISELPSSTPVTGLSFDVNQSNLITISGLVNTIGADKTYTLTIPSDTGIFSTSSGSDITITITEPQDFSPGDGDLTPSNSFTISNDNNTFEYLLKVPFSGAAIEEWLTETTFSDYFTGATFAGQTLDSTLDSSVLSFNFDEDSDEYSIAINGSSISNLQNGSLVLTTTNIADGYTVTQDLSDPDGSEVAALTDGDAGSITITEVGNPLNTKTYTVFMSLAAYTSPVEASQISVTGLDGSIIDSDDIEITIEGNIITISGVTNIDGTSGSGSVTITPLPNTYTISPSTPLSFNNRDAADALVITLDETINITDSNNQTVAHTIKINFRPQVILKIDGPNIIDGPVSIESGGTVNIEGLAICEVLTLTTIELMLPAIPDSSITGFPIYFDEISVRSSSITKDITILNGDGSVFLDDFTVTVAGFPVCDGSVFTTSGKAGTVDDPYLIDSAPKLELISYLLKRSFAAFSYKSFKLTTNIDLGTANLPWSETAGGEGFPPIGRRTSQIGQSNSHLLGSFDCDNNTISNLYINRPQTDEIGLFGYITTGSIQNCVLIDVNVTGSINVGGLVGYQRNNGSITQSYVTGTVSGTENVGGLAGNIENSSIENSYYPTDTVSVSVSGTNNVGGLVGTLKKSSITDGYVRGIVRGNSNVGGVAGYLTGNHSTITDTDAFGEVSGSNYVGGLAGYLEANSIIIESNASGNVRGSDFVGGLAGYLEANSSISNSASSGNVNGSNYVGGLAGHLANSRIENNSFVQGKVSGGNDTGGLVGHLDNSSITNTSVRGVVLGTGNNVGGIAGFLTNSTISNSYVTTGGVTGSGNNVGGIAGQLSNSSISDTYTIGSVSGLADKTGGLVGFLSNSSNISNSYFGGGSVQGRGNFVGGLVGELSSPTVEGDTHTNGIINSYATGNISGRGESVGGIAGWLTNSKISNSYFSGESVIRYRNPGVEADDYQNTKVGGIAGWLEGNSLIKNSYVIGHVDGSMINNGALAGGLDIDGNNRILNSYWNSDHYLNTVPSSRSASVGSPSISHSGITGVIGKTATELQSNTASGGSIYTEWDSDIWQFNPTNQYPRLKTVTCANRQYPADPSNVPTECTAL